MIISEKQLMQLIMIAEHHVTLTRQFNDNEDTDFGKLIRKLVIEIVHQQSEELKVIE